MKYLFLLFISLSATAETEVAVTHLRINQDLFGTISFPMDAVNVDATYWHETGLGFRVAVARSTETANSLFLEGLHYSNKINAMYGAAVMYRYKFDDWTVEAGFGKTDYKATWKVNGVVPAWGDNTADSDWSYHVGVTYPVTERVAMRFNYSDIYRKHVADHGREKTKAFGFGFIYKF